MVVIYRLSHRYSECVCVCVCVRVCACVCACVRVWSVSHSISCINMCDVRVCLCEHDISVCCFTDAFPVIITLGAVKKAVDLPLEQKS